MTLRIEKQITRFKIPMNKLARMHIFQSFEELIDDEFFMYFFKNTCPDDNMQIYIIDTVPVYIKSKTR
jgi:hypothetical protein